MQKTAAPREAWTDWAGSGRQIVFGHANGFPPGTYRLLFEELGRSFSVASFAARPLWPGSDPLAVSSWRELAGDLMLEMRRREIGGALAVGHSLGSVLHLLGAAADPGPYRALVLVDPVVFTGFHSLFWGVFKGLGFSHRLPLIRGAQRRRESYADLDEVRGSWSGKPVFSSWDPEVLEDYIQSAFAATGRGEVKLRYPKAWETRIFQMTPADLWPELRKIDLPMLFIRGARSDTFLPAAAERVRRILPTAQVIEVSESSHFVPMERPLVVARLIVDWAGSIGL